MYYFILGKTYLLSIAEITNVLGLKSNEMVFTKEFIIIDQEIDLPTVFQKLGGALKGGKIIKRFELTESKDIIGVWLKEYTTDLYAKGVLDRRIKFSFGFSYYNSKNPAQGFIKSLAMELKKNLKDNGINSRWVVSKEKNLSSVVVEKNNLFPEKNGIEINLIFSGDKLYIGQTIALQNFEEYSLLDYGRPARDSKSGMIPLKLAQMLVNLANVGVDKRILDPFCGSGTILQEALMLGYKNIIGSDLSKKALNDSELNLKWLGEIKPELSMNKIQLINVAAEKLSGVVEKNSIDAIITEPYLGPSHNLKNLKINAPGIIKNLSQLYIEVFKEFQIILKKGGVVVMVLPVFKIIEEQREYYRFMPVFNEAKALGFEIMELISPDIANKVGIRHELSKRNTIIYARENQFVLREIIKLQKI